jgi:dTDP-4-dehydrorhamnose reductase
MRVLVTGAAGFLGAIIVRHLDRAGYHVIAATREGRWDNQGAAEPVALDLLDPAGTAAAIKRAVPDAVVHGAAIGDTRACEQDPVLARRVNIEGTRAVAGACAEAGCRMVFLSSEQVFDGTAAPYHDDAPPRPVHEYGRTKAQGERITAELGPRGTTARLALVYGRSPAPGRSASEQLVAALRRGERVRLFVDEWRTPVHAEDAASAIAELVAMAAPPAVLNLGGPERLTRHEFGLAVARHHGLDERLIEGARQADVASIPARPRDLSLRTDLAKRILARPPRSLAERLSET